MSKVSMRRRKNWSRWWSFSRIRKNIRDSAVEFRRGSCWSALRARVKPYDPFGTAGADLRVDGWPRSGGDDFRRCVHRRAERSTEGDGNRPHDGNSVWYERPLGFGRFGRAAATGFLPVGGQSHKENSEETARIVDEEIKLLLTDAHQKLRSFLSSGRDALEELAQLLLEKEVVERPALRTILNGRRTKNRDATETEKQEQGPSDGRIGKPAKRHSPTIKEKYEMGGFAWK